MLAPRSRSAVAYDLVVAGTGFATISTRSSRVWWPEIGLFYSVNVELCCGRFNNAAAERPPSIARPSAPTFVSQRRVAADESTSGSVFHLRAHAAARR